MGRKYRVGEVAALTGVSIRTLHHYDRIGLLGASARTKGGHRLYAEADLLRLQQILTLRYLGFPLKTIGGLLGRPDFDLVASLRIQRGALRDRISELARIEAALDELLGRRLATGDWAWELVVAASASVQGGLAQKDRTMETFYTPEQLREFAELGEQVSTEDRGGIEQGWVALIGEVRASRHLDPASPQARALADRWNALAEATARGFQDHPELWAAIDENYRHGRFDGRPDAPDREDLAFIAAVNAARDGEGGAT